MSAGLSIRGAAASARSFADALRRVPFCRSKGKPLLDLDTRECRFPVEGTGEGARFCAVEISGEDWRPGFSGGCYCRFHRVLTRLPREEKQVA